MISVQQKKLVQSSFELVLPMADIVIEEFYRRLFELDPSLRPLFKISMVEQERKLIDMLCVAVYGLDHLSQLIKALELLGVRHAGYGVKTEHYELVERALIWSLAQGLDEDFTPEVRAAWTEVYQYLASTMQQVVAS